MHKFGRWRSVLVLFVTITTLYASQESHKRKQLVELPPGENVLWTDPGDVASLDFTNGIGGPQHQPKPPFHFVREDLSGTNPKVDVLDADGASWNVKWGHEAPASTFCTRLLWACGYVTEPEYFLEQGSIDGAHGLTRAKKHVSDDGSFTRARFQLRSNSPKFLSDYHWTWIKNPFLGTHELQGLKILLFLVSNWDTKAKNLSVFEDNRSGSLRHLYADVDWGASLGKWGGNLTWTKWDCKGFAEQTPDFVKGVEHGSLKWGFNGKNRHEVTEDISVSDVQWLLKYLGKVTDTQIRSGLQASGATPEETECYARALRQRIGQLEQAVVNVPAGDGTR